MNITYDKKTDSLYLQLRKGAIKRTQEISDFCMADMNSKGDVVGFEILSASRFMTGSKQERKITVRIGEKLVPLRA
ncbi:hypothetical protein A2755_02155 [Candidatus Wolfebacteria bacterium RIFCSPHIGHO2_01_FULL_48_22]|uniref:DUF2283 domain-containing protein n=2 Tax=Candidatus Wolfeibacteriota TaxID=1752735 RepID=A0A1F8DRD0_9BACT|nr:MAG: hypothetical protein A2755_02155 [Candidatus Wolfebacteria bacterium RIFCSPHIGHO2_01_FULL_48_22]OGM92313.1 MAG: hypothetical protein A2935_00915 [Candidatus Wolfebacteria bacterium RIFCSPLOWO2_01_FULL_47_17b]